MGRSRLTPDCVVDEIRGLASEKTMRQICDSTGKNMNTVFYYLDSAGLKALPGRAGVVKIMSERLPVLSVEKIIGYLEDHFGRPIDLRSPSLFARDRERRGISLAIIRKFAGLGIEQLGLQIGIHHGAILRAIAYGFQKNLQQINIIESKIISLYATRPS